MNLLTNYSWNFLAGNLFILIGTLALILGVIGVLRFQRFTMKVLSATKIDTVAFMFILIGLMLRFGISWFTAKAFLLLIIIIYVTPIVGGQTLSRARQDGEA